MSGRWLFFSLVLVLLPFSTVRNAGAANRTKDLPPVYRHWVEAEVPYIISTEERRSFLALSTDAERDSFIESFWRVRNPDPGSAANTYKEEHYRRLAYANENFGDPHGENGWRTDRGRMYIILGPPKQRAQYHDVGNILPIEIWFYQSDTPALPPYFYLLFYRPSPIEDFRLYSPRFDTPVRLCSTGESRNDPEMALKIIRDSLGEEVARTAITLLPNESVDTKKFEPSMESDALLGAINNLPDNPITVERLEANRARERVTTSVFLGGSDTTLSYEFFRDDRGRMTLSYLLSKQFADAHIVGTHSDGKNYYDLTLRTDVVTSAGKPAYTQEDQLTGNLTEPWAEVARKKRFGAEARLPLTPGSYDIIATLTNNVDKTATRQRASVTVPTPKGESVALSSILAYTAPAAVPDPHNQLPFSGSKYRFTPRGAQNVYIREGEKLPIVFQLWLDPAEPAKPASEKIRLHYVFGSIAASLTKASQEDEEVDAGNRDQAGNLLTGHTLDTSALQPGIYQVVVSAKREGEQKAAYATLNLHIAPAADYVDMWTAYGPADPGAEAVDDLKRGLSAEAEGADADAQAAYVRALAEGPGDSRPLDNLAALLARNGKIDQLAALSQEPLLAKTAAKPSTLVAIAGALNKSGNPKAAVRMLDAQLALQPPSTDLYMVLADACEASGDTNRAQEARALAAALKK
ncbi:MAG: GWxTD domain-containing protein [Terracidiphilus sp.]